MKSLNTFDTVVVGGGVAGLTATASLGAAGQRVALLEARARLGGRVLSLTDPDLLVPADLGAEFVHGYTAASSDLLRRYGVVAVETGGEQHIFSGSAWKGSDASDGGVERVFEKLSADGPDLSFAALLERTPDDTLSAEAKAYARMLVEGFDAADPDEASSRALAREWQAGSTVGGTQFRPLGSYAGLLRALRASLGANVEQLTETVVRRVTWDEQGVTLESNRFGESLTLRARRAIITLPLSLLTSGAVTFAPDLGKAEALRGLAMGPVIKLVLVFPTPFWEEAAGGALRDTAFFLDPEGEIPTFWTSLPLPSLTAWVGGPKAAALAGRTKDELVALALRRLERIFGLVPRPERVLFHDWQADPFSRGAYSYVRVGGEGARQRLAEPLGDVLFFAGEATNTGGEDGTVYGAMQTGERAAKEVMRVARYDRSRP